jgi:outer membrane protein assembly factor BamB
MTEQSVAWSYHRSIPQLPSTLLYGGVLYVLNDKGGLLTTLDPTSGKVRERGRLRNAVDNYYASPVAADGKVYFVSESGLVSVLAAGGGLEPLAVNELHDTCYATPAIADGCIYLRTGSALYCFGCKTQAQDR